MTYKPEGKSWITSKRFTVDFTSVYLRGINQRLPICGEHVVYAVVGHKHIRICLPISNIKFRMTRGEWDECINSNRPCLRLLKETTQ